MPGRYASIRTLRSWLWAITVTVAIAGGVAGFAVTHAAASHGWAVLVGSLGAVTGALVSATLFLVLIAFLSLALDIAEGVTWITNFLYDQAVDEDADPTVSPAVPSTGSEYDRLKQSLEPPPNPHVSKFEEDQGRDDIGFLAERDRRLDDGETTINR